MQQDKFQALKDATLAGNKIEAIRLYRELFGVGLAEAKAAIEHLAVALLNAGPEGVSQSFLPAGHPPLPEPLLTNIRTCLLKRQKIAAIKLYREHNPVGLAEAKAVIDRMEDMLRTQSPGLFNHPNNGGVETVGEGCRFLVILAMIALAFGIWWKTH